MNLKNKMLLAFVFVLSINCSMYSEESETSYTDMMLERIFALKLNYDKKNDKNIIKLPFLIFCYLNLGKNGWKIKVSSCKNGFKAFSLKELRYREYEKFLPLEGENDTKSIRKERTNVGIDVASKIRTEILLNTFYSMQHVDEFMRCGGNKNGRLKCTLVISTEEFEKKFKEFVRERKEAQAEIASQKDENS